MTNLAQTKAIHALRRSIPHFTDGDYRDLVMKRFGKPSSKDLSQHQAGLLIEELKAMGGKPAPVRRASETVEGPYAGILRALWIACYNLCIINNRDDRALIAFVKRQTHIDHTRFLTDGKEAAKVIEALKAMLARKGGIEWPKRADAEDMPAEALKKMICKAVARRCYETGAFTPFVPGAPFESDPDAPGPAGCWPSDFQTFAYRVGLVGKAGFEFYDGQDWDYLANRLGTRLRAKTRAAKPAKKEAA